MAVVSVVIQIKNISILFTMYKYKEGKCESIWNKMAIFLPARAENQIGVISVDKKFQIINLLEF